MINVLKTVLYFLMYTSVVHVVMILLYSLKLWAEPYSEYTLFQAFVDGTKLYFAYICDVFKKESV